MAASEWCCSNFEHSTGVSAFS